MSLDRQQILNELGSVMNKLQSADCGCMGNIFSGQGQACTPSPPGNQGGAATGFPLTTCGGCRRGCCHGHGYASHNFNSPQYAGEPYSPTTPYMGMNFANNPRTMYADTQRYLNTNLVNPVVQEVHDELKSITPENTVGNNPLANKMGLGSMAGGAQGTQRLGGDMGNMGMGMGGMQQPNQMNQQMGYQQMNNAQNQPMQQGMNSQMGQSIMEMMASKNQGKSPHFHVPDSSGSASQGQLPNGSSSVEASGDHNPMQQQLNSMAYYTQQAGNASGGNMPHDTMGGNMQQHKMGGGNMQHQQMGGNMPQQAVEGNVTQNRIGDNMTQNGMVAQNAIGGNMQHNVMNSELNKHAAGISKFNEMFPGVGSKDLGFDPMAIAMQLNPAHRVPANSVTANNANALESLKQPQPNMQNVPIQQNPNQNYQQIPQQQQVFPVTGTANLNQTAPQENVNPQHQNQIPEQTQNQPLQNQQNQALYKQQQLDPNAHTRSQMIMDPIFPADTSEYRRPASDNGHRLMKYNTLGQLVEHLPSTLYHSEIDSGPMTLSHEPISKTRQNMGKYTSVKNTVSKTSLMGNRPLGKVPSRAQLQQVYNQYKGSHSYTQQNISKTAVGNASVSEGRLSGGGAIQPAQAKVVVPIEKVGGDTAANDQVSPVAAKEHMGHAGDNMAVDNKPQGDGQAENVSMKKCRNGLQDMVFTSYPSTAAWSFHG